MSDDEITSAEESIPRVEPVAAPESTPEAETPHRLRLKHRGGFRMHLPQYQLRLQLLLPLRELFKLLGISLWRCPLSQVLLVH